MKKIALITGITGQDGSYLAEFLLKKNYIVHGLKRRTSIINTQRIDHLYQSPYENDRNFFLHYGDLTDGLALINLIRKIKPDEIYNLAAMSHVAVSFETPEYTANVDGIGTLRVLEAVKSLGMINQTRIYQASTSELYGKAQEIPQTEKTPFYPRSPYGVAKLYAYWITINYRESYKMFASNGILFNHESPLRGETFVTRKITRAISKIIYGLQSELKLGNLDSKRDWGHAKDYVRMMWLILQHDKADDWVISTGETRTVREFVIECFLFLGIEIQFNGSGLNEVGIIKNVSKSEHNLLIGKKVVSVDERYFRPSEVDLLIGDSSKAKKELGWVPKITFKELVSDMMKSDLKLAEFEKNK